MTQFTERPTLIDLQIALRPEAKSLFVDWQADLSAVIAGAKGFISLEFLAMDQPNHWVIVQRFNNRDNASLWHRSVPYQQLLQALHSLVIENGIKEYTKNESDLKSGVVEVFITQVNPHQEQKFREWSAKIHQIEAKFPGFRGVYLQSPEGQGHNWITLLQFDSYENLDRWLISSERKEILEKSTPFISSLETHRMVSPYAGWFSSIAKTGELPSVWKQTMLVLLVLFPIVMFEIKYLNPWTQGLGPSLSTFIGNTLSVILIAFPMMPLTIYCLGWWLSPGSVSRKEKTILGTFLILLLYFLEISFFWDFSTPR